MMNHKCLVTLNILWWILLILGCHAKPRDDMSKSTTDESTTNPNNKKYCGTYLTETLATICNGVYPTFRPAQIKKSFWPSQFHHSNDMAATQYPFQSKQQATSMLGGRRRRSRRGIYNECCLKSCTKEQLMEYCGVPSSTTDLPLWKSR